MRILGFSGGMGSGKSTAIELLRQECPTPLQLVKFAQPLYDLQEMAYDRIASAYQRPASFVKDRKFLQWVGSDWGRNLSQSLWVDIWRAAAEQAHREGKVVVCDDVRFDNEAEAIHALGGKVIRIESSAAEFRIECETGIVNHASEAGVRDELVDACVPNNGTKEEFRKNLNTVYSMLGIFD
jgi:hypothetical protein